MNAAAIARVCHEANRALQQLAGEQVNFPWENTSLDLRASAIDGVLQAQKGATPEQLHESWIKFKTLQGWIYGPVKNFAEKKHPSLVPYADLPASERAKDAVFHAIVGALS